MRDRIRTYIGYGALIGVLLGSLTSAEALRCGNRIISLGYTKSEVLERCGEPTASEQRDEGTTETSVDPVTKHIVSRKTSVLVEEWTYDFGPNSLVHILRFSNNKLVKIDTAGYGRR